MQGSRTKAERISSSSIPIILFLFIAQLSAIKKNVGQPLLNNMKVPTVV